jgi:hypothetical protein
MVYCVLIIIIIIIIIISKAVPLQVMKALGGVSTLSRPRHSMGVSGQRHAPAALYSGKGPPLAIVQQAGWSPEPVWTKRLEEKSFGLCQESNLDRPVVQSVVRHFTD